jgi:hypothetical protein
MEVQPLSERDFLQCKAELDSLRRDYEKQYMELTKLRVEVERLRILDCPKVDEKRWGNHDWVPRMDGSEVCSKCGARRLATPVRAGRIE